MSAVVTFLPQIFCESLKKVIENGRIIKLGFEVSNLLQHPTVSDMLPQLKDDVRKIRKHNADMCHVFSQKLLQVNAVFDLAQWARSANPRSKKAQ
eukprot:370274-Hanusia_phi.AAC.2